MREDVCDELRYMVDYSLPHIKCCGILTSLSASTDMLRLAAAFVMKETYAFRAASAKY